MIVTLVTAPGERYVVAHRPMTAACFLTRCGQTITSAWEGLPVELTTPICPGCDSPVPSHASVGEPEPPPGVRVGSSGHPTTPQPTPTPQTPAEPLARTAERTPRGSHHNAIWRLMNQLFDRA